MSIPKSMGADPATLPAENVRLARPGCARETPGTAGARVRRPGRAERRVAPPWVLTVAALAFAACSREGVKPVELVPNGVARFVAELEREAASRPADAASQPGRSEAAELLESYASSPRNKVGVKALQAFLERPPAERARAIRDFVAAESTSAVARQTACAQLGVLAGSYEAADAALGIVKNLTIDESVRAAAASAAGAIGARAIVADLVLCLKYEKSEWVYALLTQSLSRLGNLAGIEDLRGILQRGNCPQAAGIAAELVAGEGLTLENPGDAAAIDQRLFVSSNRWWKDGEGAHTVKHPDVPTRLGFARWAVQLGLRDLRPVDDARYVLARGGRLSIESLTFALGDAELYTRVRAIEVAGALGPVAAPLVDKLVELTSHPEHRAEPLIALGRIRDRRATPVLVKALDDRSLDVRVAAARGLSALEDPAAAAALVKALDSNRKQPAGSPDVALLAARALAALGDFRGVAALVDLHDTKAPVEPGALEEALTFAFARIRSSGADDAGFSQAADAPSRWECAKKWLAKGVK